MAELPNPLTSRRVKAARGGASGRDCGRPPVLDGTDIRQVVRRVKRRADRLVGQDVETEARVPLDPLRVEQRPRRDSERGVEATAEELAARPEGKTPHAGEGRGVAVVPGIRAIEPIGCLRNPSSLLPAS